MPQTQYYHAELLKVTRSSLLSARSRTFCSDDTVWLCKALPVYLVESALKIIAVTVTVSLKSEQWHT